MMDEVLEILREYIDERISFVTDDLEWQSRRKSEQLWKEFVEAFPKVFERALAEKNEIQ